VACLPLPWVLPFGNYDYNRVLPDCKCFFGVLPKIVKPIQFYGFTLVHFVYSVFPLLFLLGFTLALDSNLCAMPFILACTAFHALSSMLIPFALNALTSHFKAFYGFKLYLPCRALVLLLSAYRALCDQLALCFSFGLACSDLFTLQAQSRNVLSD
jgi:hypothetical protein